MLFLESGWPWPSYLTDLHGVTLVCSNFEFFSIFVENEAESLFVVTLHNTLDVSYSEPSEFAQPQYLLEKNVALCNIRNVINRAMIRNSNWGQWKIHYMYDNLLWRLRAWRGKMKIIHVWDITRQKLQVALVNVMPQQPTQLLRKMKIFVVFTLFTLETYVPLLIAVQEHIKRVPVLFSRLLYDSRILIEHLCKMLNIHTT